MASPTAAANAYASLSRMMDIAGGAGKSSGAEAGGPSFGALLKDSIGSVMDVGKGSPGGVQAGGPSFGALLKETVGSVHGRRS